MAGKSVHDLAITMSADIGPAVRAFKKGGNDIRSLEKVQADFAKKGVFSEAIDTEITRLKGLQGALLQTKQAQKSLTDTVRLSPAALLALSSKYDTLENKLKTLKWDLVQYQAVQRDTSSIEREIAATERLIAAKTEASTANKTLATGMQNTKNKSNRLAQAFGQLSFGLEDFMTQVGTMGAAGGFRAAGNNISQMAHILGGADGRGMLIGGGVGIAAAILPMLITSISKMGESAKKTAKPVGAIFHAIDRFHELQAARRQFRFDIEDITGLKGIESHKQKIQELERELTNLKEGDIPKFDSKMGKQLHAIDRLIQGGIGSRVEGIDKALLFLGREHETEAHDSFQKIFDNINKAIAARPGMIAHALKEGRKEIEKEIDRWVKVAAVAEQELRPIPTGSEDAIVAQHAQALTLEKVRTNLQDLFQGMDAILDDPAQLESLTHSLRDLVEGSEDAATAEKRIQAKLKRVRASARKAEEEEQKKADEKRKEAHDSLRRHTLTNEEKIVQGVKDGLEEIKKLAKEATSAEGVRPEGLQQEAGIKLIQDTIDSLTGDDGDPQRLGHALFGRSSKSRDHQAILGMKQQMHAAKGDEEDVSRRDVLNKLSDILTHWEGKTSVAVQVGS